MTKNSATKSHDNRSVVYVRFDIDFHCLYYHLFVRNAKTSSLSLFELLYIALLNIQI